MESICFVTNLVFDGTRAASLDLVYYVFPVLHRMVSDFLIGFEWKLNKLWKFYKLYTVFVKFMVDMSFL